MARHHVEITTRKDWLRSELKIYWSICCTCPWRGPERFARYRAEADGRWHVEHPTYPTYERRR